MSAANDSPNEPASSNGTSHAELARPITIALPEEVLKRLKIIAVVREISVSDLVAEAAGALIRKELKKALGRLAGE
jgi:hypothetical protein